MNICFFAHHSISGKDGASLSMINIEIGRAHV